jgi:CelD/BcsL family acetyltransferase involved in cellulose biosynthesis
MNPGLRVDVLDVEALGPSERRVWDEFVRADARLQSPFFAFDYARIAGEIAPRAHVAVIHRAGRIVGFLPFQRRGAGVQPLAAPLTDYHGLIAAPGAKPDLRQVLQALRTPAYRFSGLVGEGGEAVEPRRTMRADLARGFDAYYAARRTAFSKYHRDKERAARSMERDHGPPEYTVDDREPGLLDWLLTRKRAQYAATGQHDVFACGWTEALLRRLLTETGSAFGGRIATLRLKGEIVAAEYSLRSGGAYHFWFPAYDPAFSRCSPGALLTLETMRRVAGEGVTSADFGLDAEGYKKYYADAGETVFEGVLAAEPWRAAAVRALDAALAGPLAELRRKAERRFTVITACEPNWTGVVSGTAHALSVATRRRLSPRAA